MKSISAAIVTAAGLVAFGMGGLTTHGDTGSFVMLVSGTVGAAGLIGWFKEMSSPDRAA